QGKGLQVSYVSAIDAWTKAGWPASQLTAGLAFYGRSTIAKEDMTKDPTNQYQPQDSTVPLGDSEDAPWYDACAGTTANSGTWQWKNMRTQGLLPSPSTAAAPWVRQWDSVSQTPWLFNPSTKQFISYDDPESLKIKVDYAASKGLAGAMIWSENMDYNNELINVARAWQSSEPSGGESSTSSTSSTSTTSSITTTSQESTSTTSTSNTMYSTSTSSVPVTKSTTTTTSETTTSSGPVAGAPCSSEGTYQCAKPNGSSASYFLCLFGKWTSSVCGAGTACYSSGSGITCDWPSS
ncbi:hypothetical protein H4S06_001369, partial [Coemansia sp. BCRC 34490]